MPDHPDDHLIGFDVRLLSRRPPPLLRDSAVRRRHLPRTDLEALVSFERQLCPQRFVHRERLTTGQPAPPDAIVVEAGENIGFDLFWLSDDLYDMAARHGQQGAADCGLAWAILDLGAAGITPPTNAVNLGPKPLKLLKYRPDIQPGAQT